MYVHTLLMQQYVHVLRHFTSGGIRIYMYTCTCMCIYAVILLPAVYTYMYMCIILLPVVYTCIRASITSFYFRRYIYVHLLHIRLLCHFTSGGIYMYLCICYVILLPVAKVNWMDFSYTFID